MAFEPAFVQKQSSSTSEISREHSVYQRLKSSCFYLQLWRAVANSVEFINELTGFLALPCFPLNINDALTPIQPGRYIQDAIKSFSLSSLIVFCLGLRYQLCWSSVVVWFECSTIDSWSSSADKECLYFMNKSWFISIIRAVVERSSTEPWQNV